MPNNISSPNFARIFGTNTSAFELFVLKRKIMGPCWLEIKNVEVSNKGVCASLTRVHCSMTLHKIDIMVQVGGFGSKPKRHSPSDG
jgi:hypothetical protein